MSPQLRPMTMGETLDRIWWIVRRRPAMFAAIGVVPMTVLLLCLGAIFPALYALGDFPQHGAAQDPTRLVVAMFIAMTIGMIPSMCVFAVFQAAACHAALAVNRGVEVTWRLAYRTALGKIGRYLWLMVLCWVAISAPQLLLYAAFGGFVLLAAHGSPGLWFVVLPLILMGYVGAVVYMVWMMLRVGLAYPAALAENLSAVQAIRRSFLLTRKGKGRMFLVLLVVYAASYAGILVVEVIIFSVGAVLALVGSALHVSLRSAVSIAGIAAGGLTILAAFVLVMALVYAVYAISLSVLYEDQALRTDGPAALTGGVA